jgi:hypothetical protein
MFFTAIITNISHWILWNAALKLTHVRPTKFYEITIMSCSIHTHLTAPQNVGTCWSSRKQSALTGTHSLAWSLPRALCFDWNQFVCLGRTLCHHQLWLPPHRLLMHWFESGARAANMVGVRSCPWGGSIQFWKRRASRYQSLVKLQSVML